jgi:hypothetical protein
MHLKAEICDSGKEFVANGNTFPASHYLHGRRSTKPTDVVVEEEEEIEEEDEEEEIEEEEDNDDQDTEASEPEEFKSFILAGNLFKCRRCGLRVGRGKRGLHEHLHDSYDNSKARAKCTVCFFLGGFGCGWGLGCGGLA